MFSVEDLFGLMCRNDFIFMKLKKGAGRMTFHLEREDTEISVQCRM